MPSCTQLTGEERYRIFALRQTGRRRQENAALLIRAKSVIGKGLGRNMGLRCYPAFLTSPLKVARFFRVSESPLGCAYNAQHQQLACCIPLFGN